MVKGAYAAAPAGLWAGRSVTRARLWTFRRTHRCLLPLRISPPLPSSCWVGLLALLGPTYTKHIWIRRRRADGTDIVGHFLLAQPLSLLLSACQRFRLLPCRGSGAGICWRAAVRSICSAAGSLFSLPLPATFCFSLQIHTPPPFPTPTFFFYFNFLFPRALLYFLACMLHFLAALL